MFSRIIFKNRPEYQTLGRNGFSQAHGIEITQLRPMMKNQDADIILEPINSRGDIGRARLVLPRAHLAELRDAIDRILTAKTHDCAQCGRELVDNERIDCGSKTCPEPCDKEVPAGWQSIEADANENPDEDDQLDAMLDYYLETDQIG